MMMCMENFFCRICRFKDFELLWDLKNATYGDLFKNNFIDILIDPKLAVKASLGILTEMITTQLKTTFTPITENKAQDQNLEDTLFSLDGKNFSIIDFADEYINSMSESDETKEKMKKTIKMLYKRITDKDNTE